jgi:hypothetical protein
MCVCVLERVTRCEKSRREIRLSRQWCQKQGERSFVIVCMLTQITFLAYLLQVETRVFVVIGRLTPGTADGNDVL